MEDLEKEQKEIESEQKQKEEKQQSDILDFEI